MLKGDTKPLTAPLLAPSSAAIAPAAEDEWDCRGFEGKPLKGGVQMVHEKGQKVAFLNNNAANDPQTWANTMSKAAHEETLKKQRRLLKAIAASAIVMLLEFAGGLYAHSLALLSDSAHMLADIASYCIALVALQVTLPMDTEAGRGMQQKISERASYGLHRVEVLGGMGSILVIWFTAGGLLHEGACRLVAEVFGEHVPEVNGVAFVVVAACGLIFNALILFLFKDVAHSHGGHGNDHGHSHGDGDVTARAAIVHAAGDIAQSVGMLLTASLITLNGERWSVLDPVVTILCSLYMLHGTFGLLREVPRAAEPRLPQPRPRLPQPRPHLPQPRPRLPQPQPRLSTSSPQTLSTVIRQPSVPSSPQTFLVLISPHLPTSHPYLPTSPHLSPQAFLVLISPYLPSSLSPPHLSPQVFLVLIEATPLSVDAHAVRDALRKRSEVLSIRCFHVWALAPSKVMLTACVQTTEDCEDTDDVLRDLQSVCRYKFGIHHATFQVTRDPKLM